MPVTPKNQGEENTFVLRGVAKRYGDVTAVAPLSLEVCRGERVAILGPSGSGKTTLLHLLGGVVRPDEGLVSFHGISLSDFRPGQEFSDLVGFIHQQFDLVPHLSVVHNVMAGNLGRWGLLRSLVSLLSPRDVHLATDALGKVGIADKMYDRVSHLSGGEQQRVAIARLLVQAPLAILADEPVASLDPTRADDLMALLVNVAKESSRTLIASLHNTPLARKYFTRAIGIRGGILEFDVPIPDLKEDLLVKLYELEDLEESDGAAAHASKRPQTSEWQGSPHHPASAGVPVEFHRRNLE